MPRSVEDSRIPLHWIAWALLILAVSCLGLRLISGPPAFLQDPENSPYLGMLESFVGTDNVRVGDSGHGDIIVLLNADRPQELRDPRVSKQISNMMESMVPDRGIQIMDSAFVDAPLAPAGVAYIIEILLLSGVVVLSIWLLANSRDRYRIPTSYETVAANDTIPRPSLPVTPAANPASSLEKAASLAERQPALTAKIIAGWLNDKEQR
ncbi:MAG: hypothetical protein AAF950_05500 [Pseudomonadota bacterium]